MNIFTWKQFNQKRSLIWLFAITDLKIRYRNSILGFFWSILEPMLMLSVLYFVFSYLFHSDIENYPLFLLIGLIIWNTFSRGTVMASNSILARSGIILSISFPKIIFPLSSVITSFLMMLFEMLVFGVFLVVFQFTPPITALILPLAFIPLFIFTLGISLSLSSMNVMYRDVVHIWNVVIQAGFFLTPIIYQIKIFPQEIQSIIMLNPMAHIVSWSHELILYGTIPDIDSLIFTFGVSIGIFLLGFFIFRQTEKQMVDKL